MSEKEGKALTACRNLVSCMNEVKRFSADIGDFISKCSSNGSHLAEAYSYGDEDDSNERYYFSAEEQEEILKECPACRSADEAIQLRKAAKKKVASAKRAITRIGKICLILSD